jgi:hypothetical protein
MIWDAGSMNSFNQYTQYNSGNGLSTTKTYDCPGMLRGITTGSIQNLGYSFDEETGNLISRRDNLNNLTEIFSYDNPGRLTEVCGPSPLSMDFANNEIFHSGDRITYPATNNIIAGEDGVNFIVVYKYFFYKMTRFLLIAFLIFF